MPDPAMDFETLQRRTLNDAALMAELLGLFRGEMTTGLARLRAAAEADDVVGACKLAHRLKGSAATISAPTLAALLNWFESLCTAGDGKGALALIPQIQAEYDRCVADMDARGV